MHSSQNNSSQQTSFHYYRDEQTFSFGLRETPIHQLTPVSRGNSVHHCSIQAWSQKQKQEIQTTGRQVESQTLTFVMHNVAYDNSSDLPKFHELSHQNELKHKVEVYQAVNESSSQFSFEQQQSSSIVIGCDQANSQQQRNKHHLLVMTVIDQFNQLINLHQSHNINVYHPNLHQINQYTNQLQICLNYINQDIRHLLRSIKTACSNLEQEINDEDANNIDRVVMNGLAQNTIVSRLMHLNNQLRQAQKQRQFLVNQIHFMNTIVQQHSLSL